MKESMLQKLKKEFERLDQLDKTKRIVEKFKVFEEVTELVSDFADENDGRIVGVNYQYLNASITIECPLFDVIPIQMQKFRRLINLTDDIAITPLKNSIRLTFDVNNVFEFTVKSNTRKN